MPEKGRKDNSQERYENTVVPKSAVQGILTKQDELIQLIKDLMEQLDNDGGVSGTTYRANHSDDLDPVDLK